MEVNLIIEEIFVNITQYSQSTYIIVNTVFDENTGTWSGGGGATVQYTDYSF